MEKERLRLRARKRKVCVGRFSQQEIVLVDRHVHFGMTIILAVDRLAKAKARSKEVSRRGLAAKIVARVDGIETEDALNPTEVTGTVTKENRIWRKLQTCVIDIFGDNARAAKAVSMHILLIADFLPKATANSVRNVAFAI